MQNLQHTIEHIWNNRELLSTDDAQNAIRTVIEEIDKGRLRTAQPSNEGWKVNDWVKKAVILYFPIQKWKPLKQVLLNFTTK